MNRERALKIVLVLVGLFFVAGIYPLMTTVRSAWQANNEDAAPMMLSFYVTLVVVVLLATRNPSANRSLSAVMAVHVTGPREGLLMVSALLGVIGVALIVPPLCTLRRVAGVLLDGINRLQ